MESSVEKTGIRTRCQHMKNINDPFMIRETENPDYRSAMVLLSNIGEKRETTSLEREALSSAVRLLKQKMDEMGCGSKSGARTS